MEKIECIECIECSSTIYREDVYEYNVEKLKAKIIQYRDERKNHLKVEVKEEDYGKAIYTQGVVAGLQIALMLVQEGGDR